MATRPLRFDRNRDQLRQLRTFCEAARLRSMSLAAEHLGLTQPAVSRSVRELEFQIQATLFQRVGRGIGLTAAGERFYALARPLVEEMQGLFDNFAEHVENDVTGHLEIAASVAGAAVVLPPYVKRFRDRHPGMRLRVRSCALAEGLALLQDGTVELALGARESPMDSSIEYREMMSYEIVLVTSLGHPLADRETVTLPEAVEWPMIMPPPGSYSREFGEAVARAFGVDLKAAVEVRGWGVIKRYVEQGLGVCVAPSLCIHETDQLAVIPFEDGFEARSYGVYNLRDRALPPPARHFHALLTTELAASNEPDTPES